MGSCLDEKLACDIIFSHCLPLAVLGYRSELSPEVSMADVLLMGPIFSEWVYLNMLGTWRGRAGRGGWILRSPSLYYDEVLENHPVP